MFSDEFTIVFNRFQRPFLNKILDAIIIQNIKRTSKISPIIRYSNCNLYILIMNQEGLNQFNRLVFRIDCCIIWKIDDIRNICSVFFIIIRMLILNMSKIGASNINWNIFRLAQPQSFSNRCFHHTYLFHLFFLP